MNKKALILAFITISFFSGFSFKTLLIKSNPNTKKSTMKKVTGLGGIFFKCKDPEKVKEWYHNQLGLNTSDYGASFEWIEDDGKGTKATTAWSPFKETTKYFEPSSKDFMINYRVADLEALVKELKSNGVTVLDAIETYDYGKFVHILDIEGNKVELWEPKEE
jgi:predicted enzyme related to lactoylglutathione lyase